MRRPFVDTSKMTVADLAALRKAEYGRFKPIKCPLLGEEVTFNSLGFFHLTHNGRRRFRCEGDQRMRLNLLPDVREVIKKSIARGAPDRVMQACDPDNKFKKDVEYYELYHRFSTKKAVAVVLRRIGEGSLHFYSVRYTKKIKTPKKIA